MRPLETLIPTVLAVFLAWPVFSGGGRPRWVRFLPALALLLTLVHLFIEKTRWQMLPLYIFVGLGFLLSLRNRPASRVPMGAASRGRNAGSIVGLFLLALAAALPLLLPVPKLPTPSGPYAVGTFSTMLVDESREEIYSDQPGEPRRLMVQFWYPAQPAAGAQPGPWMDAMEIMGPAISRWLDLPPFFLDHLRLARTHSYPEAPLLPGTERFPVLLFSHGWSGFRQQNTYQVEELASHGYVIVAVQHTYGSMATVFPDGQVAPLNPDALPTGLSGEAYQKAANRLVTQWAQDLSFVLDTLEGLNAKDPSGRFTGRLDMENVGAFGHSTGGGAVIEFCSREPRCKAGLTMDAYMIPVSLSIVNQGALSQPFLFMFSERWPTERNTSLFNHLYTQLSTPAYQITLPGTDHYDFTDMPMLSPVAPWLGLKGPLKGSRVMQIVDGFSRAFFDTYLKGQPSPLLERPESAFPEVTFKRR